MYVLLMTMLWYTHAWLQTFLLPAPEDIYMTPDNAQEYGTRIRLQTRLLGNEGAYTHTHTQGERGNVQQYARPLPFPSSIR